MTEFPQTFLAGHIRLHVGDLTEFAVDAIVNAANRSLLGGGGVDGAIHRRGGPQILAACREIRRSRWPDGLPVGEAVATTAGQLPARHVIHTVGPIYGHHDGAEAQLLAACYRNALRLAADLGLRSIAFPAISTGIYGFPPQQAAPIVSQTLQAALPEASPVDTVHLVFFDQRQLAVFIEHQVFQPGNYELPWPPPAA